MFISNILTIQLIFIGDAMYKAIFSCLQISPAVTKSLKGSFNSIGGLAAVDDQLYVTDSMNSQGHIMLTVPLAPDARNIL